MKISAVIPTRNRPESLKRLLQCFQKQLLQMVEIIIVDSSDDTSYHTTMQNTFSNLPLVVIKTDACSVCIQRNIGIQHAKSEWIFLCDDDLEIPSNYLTLLATHICAHDEVGAVSGLVMQRENGNWTSQYPITSSYSLLWRFIFNVSIWGSIQIENQNPIVARIKRYYSQKDNHISKAGWPVITNFTGEYFTTPIYGLGASLVKRKWLLDSPYDEVLDSHGIGDNYGVALGFPGEVHVLSSTFVHHHVEKSNRLHESVSYYRRVLALHYFIRKSTKFSSATSRWLLWSLVGNTIKSFVSFRWMQAWASWKAMTLIMLDKNPYWIGFHRKHKTVKPQLTFSKSE